LVNVLSSFSLGFLSFVLAIVVSLMAAFGLSAILAKCFPTSTDPLFVLVALFSLLLGIGLSAGVKNVRAARLVRLVVSGFRVRLCDLPGVRAEMVPCGTNTISGYSLFCG
jgi:hypothetical protein